MNRKKYEIYESKEYNNIREVLDNAFTINNNRLYNNTNR